ncbi:MAG: FAD-dependent oxidoreductase [Actinomycetota bacterium]
MVGAGVVGTAAALELTRRGHEVGVIDRFAKGHVRGSSHGPVRIFRLAYPDSDYVKLGVEALADWQRLQRDANEDLIVTTGGLDVGAEAFDCAAAMTEHGVDHEVIAVDEIAERFGYRVGSEAVYTPSTGVIAAERTVQVQTTLAERAGATFRYEAAIRSCSNEGDLARVDLGDDPGIETILCRVLVLAAGAWVGPLAATAGIEMPLFVSCEQVGYFDGPDVETVLIDRDHPTRYLVPKVHDAPGIRVGLHHSGRPVDPDDGPFAPDDAISEQSSQWLRQVTGAEVNQVLAETCLYTNAPQEDFILKRHGAIVVVSACSGHGFKFAPRMGRAVADIVQNKDPQLPGRLGAWWRPG